MSNAVKIWKVLKNGPFAGREWEKGTFVSMTFAEARAFKSAGYITEADALEYQEHISADGEGVIPMTSASDGKMFEIPVGRAEVAAKQAAASLGEAKHILASNQAVLEEIRRERAAFSRSIESAHQESKSSAKNHDVDLTGIKERIAVVEKEAKLAVEEVKGVKSAVKRSEAASTSISVETDPVDTETNRRLGSLLGTTNLLDARMTVIEKKVELSALEEGGNWGDAERAKFDTLSKEVKKADQILRASERLRQSAVDDIDLSDDALWRA